MVRSGTRARFRARFPRASLGLPGLCIQMFRRLARDVYALRVERALMEGKRARDAPSPGTPHPTLETQRKALPGRTPI